MKINYTGVYTFLCIISSLSIPVSSAYAAVEPGGNDPYYVSTGEVHVSRSSTQGPDYSKAATLAYTSDSTATAHYNIDGSIGYTFGEFPNNGRPIKFSGFVEEHKNSITSKKQDVVSGGLSFDAKYGHLSEIQWQPKFYISDIHDHGLDYKGWATLIALSGISKPWAMNYQELSTSGIQWNWSPQIGIQYNRATTTNNGSATREFAMVDFTLAPLFPWEKEGPDRQLSFTVSHKTIIQSHESGVLDTQQTNHHLDSISANWALSQSKTNPVALTFSRSIGSDPMESLPKKGVSQLSISFKF